jgi:hypothetical protein
MHQRFVHVWKSAVRGRLSATTRVCPWQSRDCPVTANQELSPAAFVGVRDLARTQIR